MNNTQFGRVSGDVYALAVWDEGWQSYNNSYLILRNQQVMLIDTGKAEHFHHLQGALETLGKTASDVAVVLATHGHADYIGSVGRFPKAVNTIHPHDVSLLSPEAREHFTFALPDQGEVFGLMCWLWGDHTAGACVLHDAVSGVTFAGDPLCFFGEPLPEGALVARADALREALVSWVGQGELYRDPRVQPERFRRGLAYLASLEMSYLATGHGVVLCEDLAPFFQAVLAKA